MPPKAPDPVLRAAEQMTADPPPSRTDAEREADTKYRERMTQRRRIVRDAMSGGPRWDRGATMARATMLRGWAETYRWWADRPHRVGGPVVSQWSETWRSRMLWSAAASLDVAATMLELLSRAEPSDRPPGRDRLPP